MSVQVVLRTHESSAQSASTGLPCHSSHPHGGNCGVQVLYLQEPICGSRPTYLGRLLARTILRPLAAAFSPPNACAKRLPEPPPAPAAPLPKPEEAPKPPPLPSALSPAPLPPPTPSRSPAPRWSCAGLPLRGSAAWWPPQPPLPWPRPSLWPLLSALPPLRRPSASPPSQPAARAPWRAARQWPARAAPEAARNAKCRVAGLVQLAPKRLEKAREAAQVLHRHVSDGGRRWARRYI
mmetsp:Transcript_76393/g.247284  ORF Transcript_76393/g.247284 Transcript_76393/m.247284 type:complete len:237 (-) Transcript_76393:20-730(-)